MTSFTATRTNHLKRSILSTGTNGLIVAMGLFPGWQIQSQNQTANLITYYVLVVVKLVTLTPKPESNLQFNQIFCLSLRGTITAKCLKLSFSLQLERHYHSKDASAHTCTHTHTRGGGGVISGDVGCLMTWGCSYCTIDRMLQALP